MAHRIRNACDAGGDWFSGPVEVDEASIRGLEPNMRRSKKLRAGCGTVGKTAVVGAKDRATNRVDAEVTKFAGGKTLRQSVYRLRNRAQRSFRTRLPRTRAFLAFGTNAVKHSVGEYVDDQAHTNCMESFWALLKRGYHGTCHKMSVKHLRRYVTEFAGRHNARKFDTLTQMVWIARRMVGKRLKIEELTA